MAALNSRDKLARELWGDGFQARASMSASVRFRSSMASPNLSADEFVIDGPVAGTLEEVRSIPALLAFPVVVNLGIHQSGSSRPTAVDDFAMSKGDEKTSDEVC